MLEQSKYLNFTKYVVSDDRKYFSSAIKPNSLGGVQRFSETILSKVLRNHDVLPNLNNSTSNLLDDSNINLNLIIQYISDNWPNILSQNALMSAMIVFGILVAIVLPMSGVVVAIRYFCCQPCLKRKEKALQARDKWIFYAQSLTTIFLLAMGWIGIGCLNASNLAVQDGLKKLPSNING